MKNIYSAYNRIIHFIMTFYETPSHYQHTNQNLDVSACNTNVSTGRGNYSTQFKFPSLNSDGDLITFLRHRITVPGNVTMILEYDLANSGVCANHVRNHTLTVPGSTSLANQISVNHDSCRVGSSNVVSFNGRCFSRNSINSFDNNENRTPFFRLKLGYFNGYKRISEIKPVELESTDVLKINIYPSPYYDVVGIKFVNIFSGKFFESRFPIHKVRQFSAKSR